MAKLQPKPLPDIIAAATKLSRQLKQGAIKNFDPVNANKCLIGQLLHDLYNTRFWSKGSGSDMIGSQSRAMHLLHLNQQQFEFLWSPENRKTVRGFAGKLDRVAAQLTRKYLK